jgi:hypothetical protein
LQHDGRKSHEFEVVWALRIFGTYKVTNIHLNRSQNSSINSDQATGWKNEVRFSAEAGIFFLRYHIQTGSEAHPASYPVGTGGSFLMGEEAKA